MPVGYRLSKTLLKSYTPIAILRWSFVVCQGSSLPKTSVT